MNNFKIQNQILGQIKNYNNKISKKIDPSISPYTYMTPWAETFGYYKLENLINNFKFKSLLFPLKDYLSIKKNMSCLKSNRTITNTESYKHKILIISYCQKSDFKKGIFYDQYFNFSSKQNNYLWILVSLDNYVPKKISKNVLIFFNDKNNCNSKFIISKFIIKYLFKKNFGLTNFIHWANSSFFFSDKIKNIFKKILGMKNIKKIIINYEAIPFQHALINEAKNLNKNVKIFCYLHCAGWPFQSDLIYRNKKIDKLFVSGVDQMINLNKYLGWPNKKLKNIASLRFSKKDKNDFGGQIFVPYKITKEFKIIVKLESFLKNSDDFSLNKFKVRIHPLNIKSKKHQKFKNDLQKLLSDYKNKFSAKKKKKIAIVFGSVTGITIQALECGVDITHFPNDQRIDVFNEVMWPNIKVKNLNGIYRYSLKKNNKNFWVKYKKPSFENCFVKLK